jgi:hypothetical protein
MKGTQDGRNVAIILTVWVFLMLGMILISTVRGH